MGAKRRRTPNSEHKSTGENEAVTKKQFGTTRRSGQLEAAAPWQLS